MKYRDKVKRLLELLHMRASLRAGNRLTLAQLTTLDSMILDNPALRQQLAESPTMDGQLDVIDTVLDRFGMDIETVNLVSARAKC